MLFSSNMAFVLPFFLTYLSSSNVGFMPPGLTTQMPVGWIMLQDINNYLYRVLKSVEYFEMR